MRPGVVGRLVDLLLPPACGVCGTYLPAPAGGWKEGFPFICGRCATWIRPLPVPGCPRCSAPLGTGRRGSESDGSCRECEDWPEALLGARSAALLAPPADDLVHGLKYGGWPEAARPMARAMAPLLRAATSFPDAPLVPVPTTAARERQRGYNQAELLARELAKTTGRRVLGALLRTGAAATQVALHREERRANVRGAFRVPGEGGIVERIRGRSLVLVDDVLTTGATASEAAATLADAGAGPVLLVTFARALPGLEDDLHGPPSAHAGLFRLLRRGRRASIRNSSIPEAGRS